MAVVSMKRMSVIAHNSERSRLLRIFIKSGCVECLKSDDIQETDRDRQVRAALEEKKFRFSFAMNFLKENAKDYAVYDKKANGKINLKKENVLIPLEQYEEIYNNDVDLQSKIDDIFSINKKIADLRAEKLKIHANREQLKPYLGLNVVLGSEKDTKYMKVWVGTIPAERYLELVKALPDDCVIEKSESNKIYSIYLISYIDNGENIEKILGENEFVKNSFNYGMTADEKDAELASRLVDIDEEIKGLVYRGNRYQSLLKNLKIAYDYTDIQIEKMESIQNSTRTEKAILFEAWVPASRVDELDSAIKEKCKAVSVEFRDPIEGENVPTLMKNNKVIAPFEGITDMFGKPSYNEKDPTIFIAFYYFLIFGFMIGDAGYGLLMTIACMLIYLIKKPVKNSGRMLLLFAFCGISTFIWGALFGGWFSIDITPDSKLAFLNKITLFKPLEEPLKMFVLALGIGVVQLGTAYAINGVNNIRKGGIVNILKGIFADFGWVVIFIGLLFLFPKIMEFLGALDHGEPWFNICSKIGMYTAIVGFAMIVIGGAIGSKNPLKMLAGAFKNIYGVINVVSDLLSYSRLFGLGLTTGVIGYVMNTLATLVAVGLGGGAAWIIGAVILIIGHVFNMGINLLGAYVHDSRLQFIEFFGKFYEGLGHAFKPLGGTSKYTYLDN